MQDVLILSARHEVDTHHHAGKSEDPEAHKQEWSMRLHFRRRCFSLLHRLSASSFRRPSREEQMLWALSFLFSSLLSSRVVVEPPRSLDPPVPRSVEFCNKPCTIMDDRVNLVVCFCRSCISSNKYIVLTRTEKEKVKHQKTQKHSSSSSSSSILQQ